MLWIESAYEAILPFKAFRPVKHVFALLRLADGVTIFLERFGMARKLSPQERLDALTTICLALPQTRREDKGSHCAFLVGKKTFAYYLNNHHDDNIISMCCRVLPGENRFLVESAPGRFYLPAYIGSRGWIALRMDLATLNWSEVKELIHGSYTQIAPNRLVSLVKR
jgi:hypothetical protein